VVVKQRRKVEARYQLNPLGTAPTLQIDQNLKVMGFLEGSDWIDKHLDGEKGGKVQQFYKVNHT